MFYSLVNLEGKTLDSFRDEAAARAALRATVEATPTLAEELLLLQNDDAGQEAGPTLMFEDLFDVKIQPGVLPASVSIVGAGFAMASATLGYAIGVQRRLVGQELAVGQ